MMYLSKGVRVPSNDAGLFCVSHRGTTFPMGMQRSALWRNARHRPRPVPVGKEGAVLRLVEKGFLFCEKEGKNNLYRPLVSDEDYRARESRSMLDRFYAGSLKNFVAAFCSEEPLSRSDLEELRRLVDEKAKEL